MRNLLIWTIWLSFLLIIAYISSSKKLLAPQIGFIAGFLIQALYAIPFVNQWDLNFNILTLQALFSGTAMFLLVSAFSQRLRITWHRGSGNMLMQTETKDIANIQDNHQIMIPTWKLIVFIIFQLIILTWEITYIWRLEGNTFAEKIFSYRLAFSTHEFIDIPLLLKLSATFCIASIYIWSYLIAHSWACKYRQSKWLLFINLVLGLSCSVLFGGRGEVVCCLVAFVVQAYLIYEKVKGWKVRIPRKAILISISVFTGVILFFQYSLSFLGRQSSESFSNYMSIYLSAELKNLDIFTQKGVFGANMTDCYIGADIARFLGKILNQPSWIHYADNPYRAVNGHQLGNVGTIFYATMHDGGIIGTLIFISIMAIVCQTLYKKAKNARIGKQVNLSIVTYSYVYYMILLSFFSCKFYEMFMCLHMVEVFVSWAIILFFLDKVTIKKIN